MLAFSQQIFTSIFTIKWSCKSLKIQRTAAGRGFLPAIHHFDRQTSPCVLTVQITLIPRIRHSKLFGNYPTKFTKLWFYFLQSAKMTDVEETILSYKRHLERYSEREIDSVQDKVYHIQLVYGYIARVSLENTFNGLNL